MNQYRNLLQVLPNEPQIHDHLAEPRQPYQCLTERHLQAMWLEQKYFKHLSTVSGIPITILSPGIWNSEAGPDFLKAHISIGGQELRGDIELHLSEESWYYHQHHKDARYDQVVLHVSFWPENKIRPILTSNGRSIERTVLRPHLTVPEAKLVKLIDLDLYPYQHFVGSGQCAGHLFSKLSEEKIRSLFQSAALWRLNQKRSLLSEKSHCGDILPVGIAMALGYKHNSEIFVEVYHRLKALKIQNESILFAHALGMCGYFEDSYRKKWGDSTYYNTLANIYTESPSSQAISRVNLRLDRIRPANHPIRRLAVLVKVCLDDHLDRLVQNISCLWNSLWSVNDKKKWKLLLKQLLEMLDCYRDEYWESHYTFETSPQKNTIALIGEGLKREILINVCLPILYGEIEQRHDRFEKLAFEQFYATLPALKAKKTTYLTHRFFGDHASKLLFSQADLQQGAYQIHKDFCLHFEASCIGCPFVERYQRGQLCEQ